MPQQAKQKEILIPQEQEKEEYNITNDSSTNNNPICSISEFEPSMLPIPGEHWRCCIRSKKKVKITFSRFQCVSRITESTLPCILVFFPSAAFFFRYHFAVPSLIITTFIIISLVSLSFFSEEDFYLINPRLEKRVPIPRIVFYSNPLLFLATLFH